MDSAVRLAREGRLQNLPVCPVILVVDDLGVIGGPAILDMLLKQVQESILQGRAQAAQLLVVALEGAPQIPASPCTAVLGFHKSPHGPIWAASKDWRAHQGFQMLKSLDTFEQAVSSAVAGQAGLSASDSSVAEPAATPTSALSSPPSAAFHGVLAESDPAALAESDPAAPAESDPAAPDQSDSGVRPREPAAAVSPTDGRAAAQTHRAAAGSPSDSATRRLRWPALAEPPAAPATPLLQDRGAVLDVDTPVAHVGGHPAVRAKEATSGSGPSPGSNAGSATDSATSATGTATAAMGSATLATGSATSAPAWQPGGVRSCVAVQWISSLLLRHDYMQVLAVLERLRRLPAISSVLLGLHKDLHAEQEVAALRRLAACEVALSPLTGLQRDAALALTRQLQPHGALSVSHKRRTGRVHVEQSVYTLLRGGGIAFGPMPSAADVSEQRVVAAAAAAAASSSAASSVASSAGRQDAGGGAAQPPQVSGHASSASEPPTSALHGMRLTRTQQEEEARQRVVLPYEHQGQSSAYSTGDFLDYLPPAAGGHGAGGGQGKLGHIMYVRDSDNDADSDEDPDADLDI